MKEGAEAKAAELGVSLKSYAGKVDGDHETQVAAIETCIADGAKGILLTASDTSSIVPPSSRPAMPGCWSSRSTRRSSRSMRPTPHLRPTTSWPAN
jgi:hypothetical protein